MSKLFIVVVLLVGMIALTIGWYLGVYQCHNLIQKREAVKNAWAQVENQYHLRSDLIPELVATVEPYILHARELLDEITKAQTAVKSQFFPTRFEHLEAFRSFLNIQLGLNNDLRRLLAAIQKDPKLKANQRFGNLWAQLEDIEKGIHEAEWLFRTKVIDYNTTLRRFPASIIAAITGLQEAYGIDGGGRPGSGDSGAGGMIQGLGEHMGGGRPERISGGAGGFPGDTAKSDTSNRK